MFASFSSLVSRPRTSRLGSRVYLVDPSIGDTELVSNCRMSEHNASEAYNTSRFLIVMDVYVFVKSVQLIFFSPYLCVLELFQGILWGKFPSSKVAPKVVAELEWIPD